MKIIKLDKRYGGADYFKFCVPFYRNNKEQFLEVREWCWNTFGPSCELEHYHLLADPKVWGWEVSQWNTRIYFKTDKELNWFRLKYG
jgi:hypothetical protein